MCNYPKWADIQLVKFKENLICTESKAQEGWGQRNQKEDKIRKLLTDAAVGPYEVTHTVWTFCCWRKVLERHGSHHKGKELM